MSLTVTRSRVKEKCGIGDISYDTTIDNLIDEFIPVIELSIDSTYLDNTELLPTLNLGATEIVCSEFLSQQAREPGANEGFGFNGIEVYSRKIQDDAERLRAQGTTRIAPYLRMPSSVVAVVGKGTEE